MANVSYPGVYMEEVASGVHTIAAASTSTPAFLGETEMGPTTEAKRITNWTEYQKYYGQFVKGQKNYLSHAIYQFFNNGGSQCYILRTSTADNLNDKATTTLSEGLKVTGIKRDEEGTTTNTEISLKTGTQFLAKNVGEWGNSLALTIEPGTNYSDKELKITIKRHTGDTSPEALEKIAALEFHDNLNVEDPDASNYIVTVLKNKSNLIEMTMGSVDPTGNSKPKQLITDFESGQNGNSPTAVNYKTAMDSYLEDITDFSLLAVPGVETDGGMFNEAVAYCENRKLQDIFYIGDAPPDQSPSDIEKFRLKLTKPNSYGAIYYPWIKALDISGESSEPILLPPSGFMAGIYARTDNNRGVWKAPAGTEATVSGAVDLGKNLTDTQQGNLNIDKNNINCLRRFPSSGIVSWGARTICPPGNEYKYVPVRRTAIMLRVSIYNGLQWAVFEPNDEELWGQIRMNLDSFMTTLFRQGAFQGSSSSQAFFVKCDNETTTQDDINLGIVNVMVGFAPLKPAEFVVVKISQMAGQSS